MLHPAVVLAVSPTCCGSAETSDARLVRAASRSSITRAEVRQAAAAGCEVPLELGAHGVVGRAGDRPEGACVEVGDPIQDRELGPRLGERHPTIRSTGG